MIESWTGWKFELLDLKLLTYLTALKAFNCLINPSAVYIYFIYNLRTDGLIFNLSTIWKPWTMILSYIGIKIRQLFDPPLAFSLQLVLSLIFSSLEMFKQVSQSQKFSFYLVFLRPRHEKVCKMSANQWRTNIRIYSIFEWCSPNIQYSNTNFEFWPN
jgi:hypothetical protein